MNLPDLLIISDGAGVAFPLQDSLFILSKCDKYAAGHGWLSLWCLFMRPVLFRDQSRSAPIRPATISPISTI